MTNTDKKTTAEEISLMAERGEDVSDFFTNRGKMKYKTTEYNLNQYKDSKNLASRIQIYSFNTSKVNFR